MSAATTIDALRDSLYGWNGRGAAWTEKQMHPVPAGPSLDRVLFVLAQAKGRIVLDIGASGGLHDGIVSVAAKCYGIDHPRATLPDGVVALDLDDAAASLPVWPDVEVVICGETLEHLGNPLAFLRRLVAAYPDVPVVVTVPNAFSEAARRAIMTGNECCNADHCAWFSPRTLKTLLERAGYGIGWFGWYNGCPVTAEGMIVVAKREPSRGPA